MGEPLIELLDAFRRNLRRAGLLRGFALMGLVLLLGLTVAAGVDYLIRPSSPAWRILLTLGSLVPAVWVAMGLVAPVLRDRLSDVEIARRIELNDPRWRGQLAAATEFVSRNPRVGSAELQQRVVDDVARCIAADPPLELVDAKRVQRTLLASAGVACLALLLACVSPSLVQAGLLRLALPFANVEWPRSVDLVIVDDSGEPIASEIQVGRGQTLRFIVKNVYGDVPDDLTLEVILPDRRRQSEPVPIAEDIAGDGNGHEIGVGTLYAAAGPLRFRVVGGDHRTMRYVFAEVVPPPVFDAIEVSVSPPAYLGVDAKAERLTTGGATSGIVGSTVSIKARANKPLSSAELIVGDAEGFAAEISDEGRSVTASFPLETPGLSSYWFRLRDQNGFENPEPSRYELRVAADAVPAVTIVEPTNNLTATADAELPIVIEARDDHWLAAVRICFGETSQFLDRQSADGSEPKTIPIAAFEGDESRASGVFPFRWDISSLSVSSGDQLTFRGEATDAFDLGSPHVGQSSPRTITIVSAAEKREELLDRQTELLNELADVRRDQKIVMDTIESLLAQLDSEGELPPEQQDLLARSELEQRRILSQLSDPEDGLKTYASRALTELHSNRLDDQTLSDRLDRIDAELGVLADNALPAADRDLTAARKAESGYASRVALQAAKVDVAVVLGSLESLLNELGAWRSRRDLGIEANEILAAQRELREETVKTGAQTLGTASAQLTGEQSAALDRLGRRQSGLSDRLARLQDSVNQLVSKQVEPGDAVDETSEGNFDLNGKQSDSRLEQVAELLRRSAMPAAARAAGESIRQNDLGDAGRIQQDLLNQLQALKDALAQSDHPVFADDDLRNAAKDLAGLAAAQTQILNELRSANMTGDGLTSETRDRLTREQSQVRAEAAAAARTLRSMSANDAAALLDESVRAMSRGSENLARREDDAAEQNTAQARDLLNNAERAAQRQAAQSNQRRNSELVESALQSMSALSLRQANVNSGVLQLEEAKLQSGSLGRSQLLTLRGLVDAQNGIAAEVKEVARQLDGATVVRFALQFATEHMQRAAQLLRDRQTGENAQREGRSAQAQLELLVALLGQSSTDEAQADQKPRENEEQSAGEMIPPLVQLELLKAMQEDVLRQTEFFDDARQDGDLTELETEQLRLLGQRQKMLVKAFESLVSRASSVGEEAAE